MSEALTKLDNLSKTVSAIAQNVFWVFIQACRTKSFVEIKPVPVVKHVEF